MNIFYVHNDPAHAAICLPDKLVVKMPLESAQRLSTAHRLLYGLGKLVKTICGFIITSMLYVKSMKLGTVENI